MALRLLTLTSRYQPARTKCASPSASLASVLFTFMSSAFLAWRASRQTIGKPSAVSAVQSQVVNGPVSRPMRTAAGAYRRTAAAIAAGSVAVADLAAKCRYLRKPEVVGIGGTPATD